jgi:L-asparaginase
MSFAFLDEAQASGRVHLIMNGSVFVGTSVEKDLTSARFSTNDGSDAIPYTAWTLITAGGSMDFELDGLDGLVARRNSVVPGFFRDTVRSNKEITPVSAFVRDSRDIHEVEISDLTRIIRLSNHEHILITMGTYNLQKVAAELESSLGESIGNKRVMITGSRMPLGLSDMSDAPFNLGYALGKIGFVDPGVHVAVNGVLVPRTEDVLPIMYSPDEIARIRREQRRKK